MAWVAIVCIALRTPTILWSGAMFCLTLLFQVTSLLTIVYRPGRGRALGVGCLVCGIGYAACLFLVEKAFSSAQFPAEIPTTLSAQWLFEKLHSESTRVVTMPAGAMGGSGMGSMMGGGPTGMGMPGGGGPMQYAQSLYDATTFTTIGHCTLTMLLGILGGMIAQWLYAGGQRDLDNSRPAREAAPNNPA